jgi:uncharacterized protein (DUF2336 family)
MTIVQADITVLLRDPSPAARSHVAAKLSRSFSHENFTPKERQLAIDIFRLLVRDTAVQVRKIVAEQLCNNPQVPHDIIKSLANDVVDVSTIVLEHSMLLTDEDLLQIIAAAQQAEKWMAIARRKHVSRNVSLGLLATKHPKTITTVIENKGAELQDFDVYELLNTYMGSKTVMESLVCRGGLSTLVAEKIYSRMATVLKKDLVKRHGLLSEVMSESVNTARDVAVIRFLLPYMSAAETEQLIVQMHQSKRLSFGVLVHALCAGEIQFFEAGMAELSGLSIQHTRILMRDASGYGIEAILQQKRVPSNFLKSLQGLSIIYRTACELTDNGKQRIIDFSGRVIDHIYTNGYDNGVENMPFLISVLKQHYGRSSILQARA